MKTVADIIIFVPFVLLYIICIIASIEFLYYGGSREWIYKKCAKIFGETKRAEKIASVICKVCVIFAPLYCTIILIYAIGFCIKIMVNEFKRL